MRYFDLKYFAVELVLLLPIKVAALIPILVFAFPYTVWSLFGKSFNYRLQRDTGPVDKARRVWVWRGDWRQFWLGPRYDTVRRLEEPD
tara:strand:- start:2077 stop:2340 length:264 start_codon:yes stop_codon:yes gene_type:complete